MTDVQNLTDVRASSALGAPILQLSGITKTYGEVQVLRGVDLTVEKGQRVCVVGPSGSGKTTLLRCAALLVEPSAGSLYFQGKAVESWPRKGRQKNRTSAQAKDYIRHVSMVFQHFELFPHLTALRNVDLAPRRVMKVPKERAEAQALELLDRVGMRSHAQAHPARLSGGQQQRVAIARALATAPDIVFFDEPTSALDPEMVDEVLSIMTDLAADGMTMVVVTHEMRFARDVADVVVVMENGVIIESGPPDELFRNQRNPRTAQILRLRSDR